MKAIIMNKRGHVNEAEKLFQVMIMKNVIVICLWHECCLSNEQFTCNLSGNIHNLKSLRFKIDLILLECLTLMKLALSAQINQDALATFDCFI